MQLDSTFPSRALLWRCSATVGATLTIPNFNGIGTSSATFLAGSNGSEAVGVICNSGQSEGVSLNDVYIIPENTTKPDTIGNIAALAMFGTCSPTTTTDSIVTCRAAVNEREIRIAIMDSGIDIETLGSSQTAVARHDTLRNWVAYRNEPIDGLDNDGNGYIDDQIGYDFVNNGGFPQDSTGHGTFVAGVISRILARNSPLNIKFYALKVLDKQNRGYEYNFIRAIDWAAKQRVQVLNCSFITSDQLGDTMQPFAAQSMARMKSYS